MRIIHISDLHFGMHHQHIVAAFLEEVAKHKPDAIIISGDLTQRAKNYQYRLLQSELLDKLDKNINLVIVPGNHDIPLYNFMHRFSWPYKNFDKYIKNNYPSKFENSLVYIKGIDSTNILQLKGGIISPSSLKEMHDQFAVRKSKINIVTFHHNLERVEQTSHRELLNYVEVVNFIKKSAVDIICTGHLHKAHCSEIVKEDGTKCILLHAGSLLCERTKDGINSYYIIDITEEQGCVVRWQGFEKDQFVTQKTFSFK